MNQPDSISDSQLNDWATRQFADYDARQPGSIFAEGVVLSVAQGYALQAAIVRLRRERGERAIGYKVGCTSPTIRRQLGIDHCVAGRLFDSERHSTGSELSRQEFANLAIEGELAVELAREPRADDFDNSDKLPACVARVFPVIELHHHVLRGERPSAGELIAHNAINGGLVEGAGIRADNFAESPALSIFADDQLLERCEGPVLLQTIHSSLKWLAGIVQERGHRLDAGQIILTGSIPSLIPVSDICRIRVEAPPFGNVEATFTA